ncbi:DUF1877 family protein [Streptomyces sp. NPDC029004]|uniref:DUF1877 family protein n=1 Tax=Streptomyces sp. NPDC029004 TaxID=3154490 RepID=UPI0033D18426
MSFHMHLRAIRETEIQDDYSWLGDFMEAAWSDHWEAERDAGIAHAIEKDFGPVHELHLAAAALVDGAVESRECELPVYGGRPVYHPSHDQPPFVLLTAAEVREASDFLTTASFDALWEAAGAKIAAPYRGWDEAEVKDIFLGHHAGLGAFYGRAASTGHAVIKAFWY